MDTGVIEAVPPATLRAFPVALEVRRAVIGRDIVLEIGPRAGVPVEETVLSLAPVVTVLGGFVLVRLRRMLWTGTVEL